MENNSSNRFNLENHKKKDLFTVPPQYFDELPSRIQSKINESKSRRWFQDFAFSPLIRNASVGIGIILVFFGLYFFNKSSEEVTTERVASINLPNEEVVDYLVNNPLAAMQVEEFFDAEIITTTFSEDEIVEQTDADDIEEIVVDL
jgi:hypothetical protein